MPLKPRRNLCRISRRDQVDFTSLGFGNVFSDHMFTLSYDDGRWHDPVIEPYGPITLEPGTAALHYGQLVFEGLKAFRGRDGHIRIFRPEANAERLWRSCERLCIPPVERGSFCEAVAELVSVDRAWVPSGRGEALYIRPLIIGTEAHLDVRPSQRYRLIIMTSPVRGYFSGGFSTIALKVETHYTRAAPGGMGFAKTAGNYAASLLPGTEARAAGFDQVLWLDGAEHRYVEEVGQMNIFFKMNGRVITPDLRGTILPGVTRDSVITLLRDRGITVEQRRIAIDEVLAAIEGGLVEEAFGVGTAAVVSPVGRIACRGQEYQLPIAAADSLAHTLYEQILGVQEGSREDTHGWARRID